MGGRKGMPDAEGGESNGKSDLDRVGLFREMGYISLKDPYKAKDLGEGPFCQDRRKGKQFQAAGKKTGKTLDVYFDTKYSRVFEGECYTEPLQRDRKHRNERLKKNLGSPFKPSSDLGRRGRGTLSAAFSDKHSAMSPLKKPTVQQKPLGKNFVTKPGRQGTGYGYVDVTIGKTYDYMSTKYDLKKDQAKQDHLVHKKKMIGKPFVSHHHPQALFDSNVYKGELEDGAEPSDEKATQLVPVPFRPSHPAKSGAQGCLNPYPKQEGVTQNADGPKDPKKVTKIFKPPGGPKTMVSQSIALLHVPCNRTSYIKSIS